jgi:hypothetical protein
VVTTQARTVRHTVEVMVTQASGGVGNPIYQGCQEEDGPRDFCPGCYVFDNGSTYNCLPNNIDKVVRLLVPKILVLVLLPMLVDYFNSCTRACSLRIAGQIKIMGEPSLIFTCL